MARHARTPVHAALVALLASLVVALGGSPAHAADRDCSDFGSQRAAQIFFLKHGGPGRDPHRLDADSDGIACETNPAPYYFGKKLPAAAPAAPVASTVRLSVSRKAGIAGESLSLTVKVTPHNRRTVVLQRKASSGWKKIASRTTSKHGRLSYDGRVRRSGTKYRAVLAPKKSGKKRWTGDVSATRRVRALKQSVVLAMPNGAFVGDRVSATVEASPARRGRTVVLQQRKGHRWVAVGRGHESRQGRARWVLHPTTPGSRSFRVVVAASAGAAAAHSGRQRVEVTRPVPDDMQAPPVPAGLAAVPGDGHVALSWQPVNASDLWEYVVYQRSSGSGWAEAGRTSGEALDVTDVVNGTAYDFAVTAVDTSDNESDRSTVVTALPVAPDRTPPGVPSGVNTTPGDSSVTVWWTAVGAPDLAEYRLYRREQGSTGWQAVDHVTPAVTSTSVGGLANGTTYAFAVSAVDAEHNESALSELVTATPVAPPLTPATGLRASVGDGDVDLSWTASSDSRVIGYRVEVKQLPDGAWSVASNGITTGTDQAVTGLVNCVTYSLSVVALAADGSESARSESVEATPQPATA